MEAGILSWSNNFISNVEVPIAIVTDLNGLNAGVIVSYYDYKPKNKTVRARQQTYIICKDNHWISIVFISSTKDYEKYKDIIDHVVSTSEVTG